MSTNEWKLLRYARYKRKEGVLVGEWEHYTTDKQSLNLNLEHGYLLLSYGNSVMESYSLSLGKASLSAVCKGDSMLVMYKLKDKSHRFRMKFDKSERTSGEENCRNCAEILSKSFPVKFWSCPSTVVQQDTTAVQDTTKKKVEHTSKVLAGEVTLSQIAEAVTSKSKDTVLPEVYQNFSTVSSKDIDTCLKLCLCDPSFPAFVGQVEKAIEKLKSECSNV